MDLFTVVMLAGLALLIVFMFRNNRKRQNDQRELQQKMQPGVRVMTNFGLYGTVISIDESENTAVLETLSGARLEVHRQTLARVIEPTAVEAANESADDPEFGARTNEAD